MCENSILSPLKTEVTIHSPSSPFLSSDSPYPLAVPFCVLRRGVSVRTTQSWQEPGRCSLYVQITYQELNYEGTKAWPCAMSKKTPLCSFALSSCATKSHTECWPGVWHYPKCPTVGSWTAPKQCFFSSAKRLQRYWTLLAGAGVQ